MAKPAKSTTTRPWLDLHPKVTAAFVTFVAIIVLVAAAALVGIDLTVEAKDFIVAGLVLVAGYLKSGD